MPDRSKTTIGFLIFPGFPMACLTSMIEPMRAANEITGHEAFDWVICSEDGQAVTSSARVAFQADVSLKDVACCQQLFLLSAPNSTFMNAKSAHATLRKLERHGVRLGAVSGGVFPLARAGLLDGVKSSVHWCYAAAFSQEFPDIPATNAVISLDRNRATVSGAAAAFDLALHLVTERLGQGVATEVACWFQHAVVRGQGVDQKVPTARAESTGDMLPAKVRQAADLFAQHMDDPIKVSDVAAIVGVSARQMERMFRAATGQSPLQYYRALRMNAARQLVQYSNDTMSSIARAVGYTTATPMIRSYREVFGLHPAEDREKINLFRVRKNAAVPSRH